MTSTETTHNSEELSNTQANTGGDPFASQRTPDNNPFDDDTAKTLRESSGSPPGRRSTDRRMSKEWDAAKVPPSRFQKRAGSIYSTPGSRDGHVGRRDEEYFKKLKEKGWDK